MIDGDGRGVIGEVQRVAADGQAGDLAAATRIAKIRNGTNPLNSSTVTDDAVADMLTGGAGRDWFWANQALDTLTDLEVGEQVNRPPRLSLSGSKQSTDPSP